MFSVEVAKVSAKQNDHEIVDRNLTQPFTVDSGSASGLKIYVWVPPDMAFSGFRHSDTLLLPFVSQL